jgi:hypothetical protein
MTNNYIGSTTDGRMQKRIQASGFYFTRGRDLRILRVRKLETKAP